MTAAQVAETWAVGYQRLLEGYLHRDPDDHTIYELDNPGLKPVTTLRHD